MRVDRPLVTLAVAAAIVLAACGSSSSSGSGGSGVHSFDEVRAGEVTFQADPTDPSREIVHVATKVPTICAIVWGTDDHFGRFNNSLSMNGTGITQHDVILPHVTPGTTYRYVIESITADGTLYRSAVGSFTTPAGSSTTTLPTVRPGTDITGHATVSGVSSEYSAAYAAKNAIDGNPATEWATKGDGDHAWITLDLGAVTDIKGVEFVTRSMADGTAITTKYTVSIDGGEPLGPFDAATTAHPNPVPLTVRGRTIRFQVVKSTGGNVGAVDIHVYG
jgi:hypothetical protein